MVEAGLEGIGKYITRRQNTVAHYIGGEGVSAVVGTGRSKSGWVKEKGGSGSGGIRWI